MVTTRVFLLASVLALPSSPGAARAQPASSPVRLTLADAVARAIEQSYVLRELDARRAQADAGVDLAESTTRPRASVDLGYQRTNHVDEFGFPQPDGSFQILYPDVPDNYSSRLDARWPLYDGGRSGATRAAASADARAALSDTTDARTQLRLQVASAYWAIVTSRANVDVLRAALKRLDAQRSDVQARLDVGLIPPSDVLNVEAQRAAEQAQLIDAEAQREASELVLRELLALPADALLELVEPLERPSPAPEGLDALVKEAGAGRADRKALVDRVEAAARRVEAARAGLRPSLALAGGVDYARPNPHIFPRVDEWNSSWDVGARVSWPIFDGGRTRAETAQAQAAEAAAGARLNEFDRQLRVDVGRRVLDLRAAVAAIGAAEEGVRSAAEAQRVLGERFKAGVATSTELLDAQVALLDAELTRTRALANAQLTKARLDRALGR